MYDKNKINRIKLEHLVQLIDSLPRKQTTLVIGIDGCGGSGKSTLASQLKEQLANVTVVHMDDFYLPSSQILKINPMRKPIGADYDWRRMHKQVLEPIFEETEGYYQRYDWEIDDLAEWHVVPVGGIIIIEGVYSIREELFAKYDFTIWVDCPREIRLLRGLGRDGEEARDMWEKNWMVSENIYMKHYKPFEKANLIVSGSK